MRVLALLLFAATAYGQTLDFPDCVPENSARTYTLCFKRPGVCSTSTSVQCNYTKECPTNETCTTPAGYSGKCSTKEPIVCDVTPSALTYRVDAVSVSRQCAGGANTGQECGQDSDCPGSTCSGGDSDLLAETSASPSSGCHSVTVPAASNIIVNAKQGKANEVHAITVNWTANGDDNARELRFCVKRQRWS